MINNHFLLVWNASAPSLDVFLLLSLTWGNKRLRFQFSPCRVLDVLFILNLWNTCCGCKDLFPVPSIHCGPMNRIVRWAGKPLYYVLLLFVRFNTHSTRSSFSFSLPDVVQLPPPMVISVYSGTSAVHRAPLSPSSLWVGGIILLQTKVDLSPYTCWATLCWLPAHCLNHWRICQCCSAACLMATTKGWAAKHQWLVLTVMPLLDIWSYCLGTWLYDGFSWQVNKDIP